MKITVLDDYQDVALGMGPWDRLDAQVVALHEHLLGDQLVAALSGSEVAVAMRERTPFDRVLLDRLPDLRLLVTTGMANASIDLDAARARGVLVCGTRSRQAGPAELTWALVLAVTRRVAYEDAAVRAGGWQTTIGPELSGRTLGVLGLGRLGSIVAGYGLVNTSRGPIVDEAALVEALRTGRIAGAGLDVFDVEPLPADHPLRTAPRAVLTPHIGYVALDAYRVFYADAVEDVVAWLAGEPVRVLT